MPFSIDGLTVEDFISSGWRDTVDSVQEFDCLYYRTAFDAKTTEAQAIGNEKQANVFALLSDLASMYIDDDDPADPLKPMWQMEGRRSAIPSDFDPALVFLTEILPHIDDAELKARVSEVLWLRNHDFRAAREGSKAYLATIQFADSQKWSHATERIERAIALAVSANQTDLVDAVIQRVEEELAKFSGIELTFLPARLMKLLQARKKGDATGYALLAETFAIAAEDRDDWYSARTYWDIQANWYKIAKNDENTRLARLRSAETFVKEAGARIISGEQQGHMVAAHFLEQAIHVLRAVGGQQERIDEIHHHLLDYQRRSVAEMKTISVENDPTELIARATEKVTGKSLYNAIFSLALLGRSPSLKTLRDQAQWQRHNSIVNIIPMTYKNAMGRTVARRDPPEVGETQDALDLRIEMYKVASFGQSLHVQALIEPARTQILREHTVSIADMMAIVHDNPFVPPGREEFFARGLYAGFQSDFVVAVHLLVPQLENSIRYILEQCDVITSGLDDEGIQDERDLNRTLRLPEFVEPLTEVLGEDLIFDLRGLLIERYGSNLRNDTAHGLLDYNNFHSVPCVYLWWLVLRLCCIPVITAMRHQSETIVADGEGDAKDGCGDGQEIL